VQLCLIIIIIIIIGRGRVGNLAEAAKSRSKQRHFSFLSVFVDRIVSIFSISIFFDRDFNLV